MEIFFFFVFGKIKKKKMENENDPNIIILYYKYVRIEDPKEEMNIQREICETLKLKGKKK